MCADDSIGSTLAAIAANKPPDASDILTLDQAKNEIIKNRKLIILYNQHLKVYLF